MRIRRATFRNRQAWLSIEDEEGNFLGTWHVTNLDLVKRLREQEGRIVLKFVFA